MILLRYWRFNLVLILLLLMVWLAVTFLPAYFARQFNGFYVFSWPFPFWMAAFGAPICFLVLIGFYAWRMDRLDQEWRKTNSQRAERDSGER